MGLTRGPQGGAQRHKASFGRFAIQQNLHRWFPTTHGSHGCKLPGCTGEECTAHMPLKCTNPGTKDRCINIHNKVVGMFATMLKIGNEGGLRITYDAGRSSRVEYHGAEPML